ncbi:MAG: dATP/dGTP pyrophosphohydrolase domain-containing protein [Azovibrio sp.]
MGSGNDENLENVCPTCGGCGPGIRITVQQAQALIYMFNGNETEITIQHFGPGKLKDELGTECPPGLYAWYGESPEEGAVYIGPTGILDDDGEIVPASFDLVELLNDQRDFSLRTFGPGKHTQDIIEHIHKELRAIESNPQELMEWVHVILLAIDGAWRAGHEPEAIAKAIGLNTRPQ